MRPLNSNGICVISLISIASWLSVWINMPQRFSPLEFLISMCFIDFSDIWYSFSFTLKCRISTKADISSLSHFTLRMPCKSATKVEYHQIPDICTKPIKKAQSAIDGHKCLIIRYLPSFLPKYQTFVKRRRDWKFGYWKPIIGLL